jgi:hypothetical protein
MPRAVDAAEEAVSQVEGIVGHLHLRVHSNGDLILSEAAASFGQ